MIYPGTPVGSRRRGRIEEEEEESESSDDEEANQPYLGSIGNTSQKLLTEPFKQWTPIIIHTINEYKRKDGSSDSGSG